MLSYRHGFHAGNHADVFKHLALSLIVQALLNKDKPVFYLDTHAGAGQYDLKANMAQKNREYASGIERLWGAKDAPSLGQAYLQTLAGLNPGDALQHYPGSPYWVQQWLRPQDRMVFCELHPNESTVLEANFAWDRRVRVAAMNGYQAVKALLPPAERRGLVLIDPAFELRDEWHNLLEAIQEGHRRWATGIFAVWYPLQDRFTANGFLHRLQRCGIRKILLAEFSVLNPTDVLRLNGSGMVVINPPWHLEEQLNTLLPWLWEKLSVEGQGKWRVEWLVGE